MIKKLKAIQETSTLSEMRVALYTIIIKQDEIIDRLNTLRIGAIEDAKKEHEFILFAKQNAISGSLREVFMNFLNPLCFDNKYPIPENSRECQDIIIKMMNAYFESKKEYMDRKEEIKKLKGGGI